MPMQLRGPVPKIGRERALFERVVNENDSVMELNLRINSLISDTHGSFKSLEALAEADTRMEILSEARTALYATAETLTPDTYHSSWVNYFKTKHLAPMFDAILTAPYIFQERDNASLAKRRREAVDGIYGATVDILEEALMLFDTGISHNLIQEEYGELRGAINELTVPALINRKQRANRLATPSLLIDDMFHFTDVNYWKFGPDGVGRNIPIQVKSSPLKNALIDIPENGIMAQASDFYNEHISSYGGPSFEASRLIVKELQGKDMTQADYERLNFIENRFLRHLDQSIDNLPSLTA